jgi:myo-inositol 2-dehydrogenase / D-chiro-inositol 1-dehydrogenase
MTVRVAFYGAGEQARPYLDALARRADVQLAGVCDPVRRAAEQVAAGWGAPVFLDADSLLEQALPDALWVCVPPDLQRDVIRKAATRRTPFFVDPPGAPNYELAIEYGKLIHEGRLVTGVGFQAAYTDVAREAKEYLGTNVVPLVLGWWLRPAREAASASALELLWNEACVLIDAIRYFTGEVARVHAFAAGNSPKPELAGGLVLHLQLARGTVAVLTLATFPRPEPRVELELSGEGWSLAFGEGLNHLRVAEQDKTTILKRLNRPVEDQVTTFLEAVATGEPTAVPTGFADALATLAVCEAAAASLREGRAVEVSEIPL